MPAKLLRLYKGLDQQGLVAVTLGPVARHLPQGQAEHLRSQVAHPPVGQNQKPAVGNHSLQMLTACRRTPANPLIARLHLPSGGTEGQSAQPLSRPTANQITQLGPTQGSGAQVMITVHQFVPEPRGGGIGLLNSYQAHRLQGLQRGLDRGDGRRSGLGLDPSGWSNHRRADRGQMNLPALLQLPQRHPATDFFELSQGSAPIQPLADPPGQSPARQTGFGLNGLLKALQNLRTKFLPANGHADNLKHQYPRCPAKNVEHAQLPHRGRGLPLDRLTVRRCSPSLSEAEGRALSEVEAWSDNLHASEWTQSTGICAKKHRPAGTRQRGMNDAAPDPLGRLLD